MTLRAGLFALGRSEISPVATRRTATHLAGLADGTSVRSRLGPIRWMRIERMAIPAAASGPREPHGAAEVFSVTRRGTPRAAVLEDLTSVGLSPTLTMRIERMTAGAGGLLFDSLFAGVAAPAGRGLEVLCLEHLRAVPSGLFPVGTVWISTMASTAGNALEEPVPCRSVARVCTSRGFRSTAGGTVVGEPSGGGGIGGMTIAAPLRRGLCAPVVAAPTDLCVRLGSAYFSVLRSMHPGGTPCGS